MDRSFGAIRLGVPCSEHNAPEGTVGCGLVHAVITHTHEPRASVPLTLTGVPFTEQMQRATRLM